MYPRLPSVLNRSQSVVPVCKLFSKAFLSQQDNQRMYRRKANSVNSCDSRASTSSSNMQGRKSWNEAQFGKTKSYKRSDNIDKELDMLARELLPRVLRMPFTAEQWMIAINSVCDQYPIQSSGDDNSENDCYQNKRSSGPERNKLPMIGLSSMETRLRDPKAKLCPKETSPPSQPQQAITLRVPDPVNLPVMWVPELPPQTTQLLQSMPCEIFQNIHRNCQQIPVKPPPKNYRSPRRKSPPPSKKYPAKNLPSKPAPKPSQRPRSRRKRRKPCCCCCRMTRQEMECSRSAPSSGRDRAPQPSPSKAASAPPPKPKSKPAPKPKTKPKPKAKPAPKAAPEPEKAAEPEKAVEAPPKVEVKVSEPPMPAAKPSKTGSDSSSDDSSDSDTPPMAPPGAAAPPPAGNDFLSGMFANNPAGGASGAASPKPAGGSDWMKDFGGAGASAPKPPASSGADWLTGGASPAAPAAGSDWLSNAAPKPAAPGSDWLS